MHTRLDPDPWARRQLTPEQGIELVKRTSQLGAERLYIGSLSKKGPFTASLNGGGFDHNKDRLAAGEAYGAADKLLRRHEGVQVTCVVCGRRVRGDMSVRIALDGEVALVCDTCFERGDEGAD